LEQFEAFGCDAPDQTSRQIPAGERNITVEPFPGLSKCDHSHDMSGANLWAGVSAD
jgi:hypothetical protein